METRVKKLVELAISEAKKNQFVYQLNDFNKYEHKDGMFPMDMGMAQHVIITKGLAIEVGEHTYKLTDKGIEFTTFRTQKYREWKDKNPIVFGIFMGLIGAGFTLIVGISLWLIQRQSNNQELNQIKKQVQEVANRVDSLTKSQFYQKKTDSANIK